MAANSVFKVTFTIQNSSGKVVAGPYNANVGVSGGTRGDGHSTSLTALLVTAISNNLLSILQAQGYSGSAAPSGTVVIDNYQHAAAPEVWT